MGNRNRQGSPTDVTEEWSFFASNLTLCREDSPKREYPLRDVFNSLRHVAKTGCQWRMLPSFGTVSATLPALVCS